MRIEIDNKWVITSDKFQFILQEKGVAKEGKNAGQEVLKSASFYPKMEQLINALILREVRDSDVESLQLMSAKIEAVCTTVSKTFANLAVEQLNEEVA